MTGNSSTGGKWFYILLMPKKAFCVLKCYGLPDLCAAPHLKVSDPISWLVHSLNWTKLEKIREKHLFCSVKATFFISVCSIWIWSQLSITYRVHYFWMFVLDLNCEVQNCRKWTWFLGILGCFVTVGWPKSIVELLQEMIILTVSLPWQIVSDYVQSV